MRTPGQAVVDALHPWPGPAPYDEDGRAFFNGRDSEAVELLRLVHLSSFATLYGKSGLGKSSLLQAGLFPLLREERFLPVYLRLNYAADCAEPLLTQAARRLLEEAEAWGADAQAIEEGETLWAYLQRRERPIWTNDNFPLTPVLVFDQFEEIFSKSGTLEQSKAMLDCMADLVGDRLTSSLAEDRSAARRLNLQSQQYRVLLSFRSEFLADVETWETGSNLPKRNSMHLVAMSRNAAIAAVEKSGAEVLERGVAAKIVDFVLARDSDDAVRTTDVEPVLLSLCCYQLNTRREEGRLIDARLLHTAGADILRNFYDDALDGMRPEVAAFVEDNLVQGRYRSSYPRDVALDNGALTPAELELLMMRRLLRVDPQGGVLRIELIHDRIVGVVRESREARLAQMRVVEARARAEQEADSERARVRADHAEQAKAWAESERRRVARWRNGLAATVLALIVALFGVYRLLVEASDLRRKAQEKAELAEAEKVKAVAAGLRAEGLRLAVTSQAMLDGTRPGGDELAFKELLAARLLNTNAEIEISVGNALLSRQYLARFKPTVITAPSEFSAVAFSPDGRWIASGHDDGTVSLRSTTTPAVVTATAHLHDSTVQFIAWRPDSQRFVSASNDATLRQWALDLRPAGGSGVLTGHQGWAYSVAYSPDGTRIVSSGEDKTIRFWDAATGKPLGAPIKRPVAVFGVGWPVGGKTVVAVEGATGDRSLGRLLVIDALTRRMKPYDAHTGDGKVVALSTSGHFAVSGGDDFQLLRRDLDSDTQAPIKMVGHKRSISSIAISPDPESRIVASGSEDQTVRLWSTGTGEQIGVPLSVQETVTALAFSPDGRRLAAGAGSLQIWELDPQWSETPATESGLHALITSRSVQLRGDQRATLTMSELHLGEKALQSTRTSDAAPLTRCPVTRADPGASPFNRTAKNAALATRPIDLARSGDARRLYSGHADGHLRQWDVASAQEIESPLVLSDCAVGSLAVSADGRHLIAASAGQFFVIDLARWRVEKQLPRAPDATASALSADGRWLVWAGRRGSATGPDATRPPPKDDAPYGVMMRDLLLEPGTGASSERTLMTSATPIIRLALRHDMRFVAAITRSGMRFWDWQTGVALPPLPLARTRGLNVWFDTDGARVLTEAVDRSVKPWPVPDRWPELMCAKIDANLSRKAWRETISNEIPYRCQCPKLPIEPDDPKSAAPPETCSAMAR